MLDTMSQAAFEAAGIRPENFGRLDAFMSVTKPDQERFQDGTATDAVTLTVGQATLLRGALRFQFANFLNAVALKAALAQHPDDAEDFLASAPEAREVLDRDYNQEADRFLVLDDLLANLVAGVEADAVTFHVPDALPEDPDVWDMDPAGFTEVDPQDEVKSEHDTTLD